MDYLTFYNRAGKPICYCEDGEHIYLFNGKPVAYFYEDSVYSYSGKHLGRFNDGWVRDNNGMCVFFTQFASGGPVKPVKGARPTKGVKGVRPVKSVRQVRPVRPVRSLSWSPLSSEVFFSQ